MQRRGRPVRYGLAINRIRYYYQQLAGERANLFLLSGHDGRGVFANRGLPVENRNPLFAFSSVVVVINGVVGGSAVAIALGALLDVSLGPAAGVGAVAALISVVGWVPDAGRLLAAAARQTEPLFPSPAAS
jgi:hypothetical protein